MDAYHRYIFWLQVAISNKGWFLRRLKFFTLNIFREEYSNTTMSMFDIANMLKSLTVQYIIVNFHELLNIQACSFIMFCNRLSIQSLLVSCKYWVVILISTRVSGYSQAILLLPFPALLLHSRCLYAELYICTHICIKTLKCSLIDMSYITNEVPILTWNTWH